jgi:hypothetical protein
MTTRPAWIAKVAVALALSAMLAGTCAVAQQAPIAIGPYVQNVSTDNATICWATVVGRVTYATAAGDATTVTGYDHHSIVLRGLKPATSYTYDVLGNGGGAGKGAFTTVPVGEHPSSFAILGDTQNRSNPAHRPIVERIMSGKPDMVFNTGDLVSDGRNILDWERFFEVNADLMRSIPYYAALGNHEHDSQNYFDFFVLPGNERYYSFNRGAAHFVVLDSPGPYPPENNQPLSQEDRARFAQAREEYWQRQIAWLKQDLGANREAKYVFVFFHYPLYSVLASRVSGASQMRERFGAIFQDYKVSAVFNGHDHNYHRAAAGGVQFVVGGVSGGAPRPTDAPQPESVKYASAVTFVRVDVGPQRAAVRAIGLDGSTIDEFHLQPRLGAAAQ